MFFACVVFIYLAISKANSMEIEFGAVRGLYFPVQCIVIHVIFMSLHRNIVPDNLVGVPMAIYRRPSESMKV